jgi:hypothetical protein
MKTTSMYEESSKMVGKSPDILFETVYRNPARLLTRCTSLEYHTESTRVSETTFHKGLQSQASFRQLTNPVAADDVFPTAPRMDSAESLNKDTNVHPEIRIKTYSRRASQTDIQARVSHLSLREANINSVRKKQLAGLFGSDYPNLESRQDLSAKNIKALRSLEPKVTPPSLNTIVSPLLSRKASRASNIADVINESVFPESINAKVGRLDKPGIQILVSRRPSHREIFTRPPNTSRFRLDLPSEQGPAQFEAKCLLHDRRVDSPTTKKKGKKGFLMKATNKPLLLGSLANKSNMQSLQKPTLNHCEIVLFNSKRKSLMDVFLYKTPGNRAVESPIKLGNQLRKNLLHSVISAEKRSSDGEILPHVTMFHS